MSENREERICSRPLALSGVKIKDPFWGRIMELVRQEMLPHQWKALNDELPDAEPSYCMRNFQVAGRMNEERQKQGEDYEEPVYTFRGFQSLPEDPEHLEEAFYGFVFQDSDFYKWIEAVAYTLSWCPNAELEKQADQAIELVCAAQQENGYLDTYYIINGQDKVFSNLRDHHELYCFGHLVEGAVAYYQATGKDRLLKAAMRFADYIADYFGAEEGKCHGYPGHEIAEMALLRLYEETKEEKYLELSNYFIEQRGKRPYYFDQEEGADRIPTGEEEKPRYRYNQAHLPVREQTEAVGHAVRAVYLYSGMADLARLKQDDSLLEACARLWNNITDKKMYITGGIGGTKEGEAFSYAYDLPNDTAYSETCAAVGLVFFARRMLQMHPHSKYADVMERALYNVILSAMALDGKSFFYVNPLECVPEACEADERKAHVKSLRQKWFGCACCPPNLARLLASLGQYAYTETADTLYVHLYIGAEITKEIGNEKAVIRMESDFPWDGGVRISVQGCRQIFTIAFRIPEWAFDYRMTSREFSNEVIVTERDGYLYIKADWSRLQSLKLHFSMRPCLMQANPRVREDAGKVAVTYGPLVYCLEEVDNGPKLHLLRINCEIEPDLQDAEICGLPMKMVQAAGSRIVYHKDDDTLYHRYQESRMEKVRLDFIPYFAWANRQENEMQVWTLHE